MKKTTLVAISFVTLLGLAIFGAYLAFGASNADAGEGQKNFAVQLQGTDSSGTTTILDAGDGDVEYECFTVDLVDLTTGRVIGEGTDCLGLATTIVPIGDDGGFTVRNITFLDLPGGTLVIDSTTTVQPASDPVPGSGLTHITGDVASDDDIVTSMSTGRFKNATGTSRLYGAVDLANDPMTFDCIFVINLD